MACPTATFLTYNSTGMDKVKAKWTHDLLNTLNVDFASIQEHFKKNIGQFFNDRFPAFSNAVSPAVRAKEQDSGRPKGGLAQLTSKAHKIETNRILTKNFRLQAQMLKFEKVSVLWINSYFPTDSQAAQSADEELVELLQEVERILDSEEFDHVLWNGDLNWDPRRRTGFSVTVATFMERIGLHSAWERFPVSHTHVHTDLKSTSILDHFMMDAALLAVVDSAVAVDLGDNLSRHSPCVLKARLGELPARPKAKGGQHKARRPAWYKAEDEQKEAFKLDCQTRLGRLVAPATLQCSNPMCKESDHSTHRDGFMLDVMGCVIEASHATIPMAGGKKGCSKERSIPGWKEEVEPVRQAALFWHSVWVSLGRPPVGQARQVMVSTRAKYHYAIRSVKAREAELKRQRLLEASQESKKDLLAEMKKIRGDKKRSGALPDQVGQARGGEQIVEEFRKVYKDLYNSLDDTELLGQLKAEMEQKVGQEESEEEIARMTGEAVKAAAGRLRPGKGDVTGSYTSDAIKNCPDIFFEHTAGVFRSWLTHGTVTLSMLSCAFLPLFKGGLKDPGSTDSWRAVAGSSVILKLLDYTILNLWGDLLLNDNLAFGYRSGTSTTECSWLVMEVADYYRRHGSPPFACTLDASKGFDRCSWKVIFRRLLDRKLPAVAVRVLLCVYTQQTAWVVWGGPGQARHCSAPFTLTNGTRQGSVISPVIWCVYCQELLDELRALGIGCHLPGGRFGPRPGYPAGGILCGNTFAGVTIYADDIMLLAPTSSALQRMVKVAEDFAASHNIRFSTDPSPAKSKSKCIWFCGKAGQVDYPPPIVLNGLPLPWVETATHLGHELHQKCTMEYDAKCKRGAFIEKTTNIRETFSFARPEEQMAAISTYASSLYGFALWDLYGERAQSAFKCWGTAAKLCWGAPRSTHRWLVDHLLSCGLPSARKQHMAMYAGFYRRLHTSAVPEVRQMAYHCLTDLRTNTARNIHRICEELELEVASVTPAAVKAAYPTLPLLPDDEWKLEVLEQALLEWRDLEAGKQEKGERGQELSTYITILCEM